MSQDLNSAEALGAKSPQSKESSTLVTLDTDLACSNGMDKVTSRAIETVAPERERGICG